MAFTNDAIAQLQARMQAGQYGSNPQRFQKTYNRMQQHLQKQAMRQAMASNPKAVASWFAQQSPQVQNNLMGTGQGGGSAMTPWGMFGGSNNSFFKDAILRGGINGNALNQMINWNAYQAQNPGSAEANKGVFDFTAGGSMYGPSMMDAFGPGASGDKNWSGSDAFNQAHPFDPAAYNGQNPAGQLPPIGAGAPGGNVGPHGPGGFGPPPPSSWSSQPGVYQGVPPSQNALNMLQQGINGSWNPYMPVYSGPSGATGDWGSGVNAQGQANNTGAWQATMPAVQSALGQARDAFGGIGGTSGVIQGMNGQVNTNPTMGAAATAQPTMGTRQQRFAGRMGA